MCVLYARSRARVNVCMLISSYAPFSLTGATGSAEGESANVGSIRTGVGACNVLCACEHAMSCVRVCMHVSCVCMLLTFFLRTTVSLTGTTGSATGAGAGAGAGVGSAAGVAEAAAATRDFRTIVSFFGTTGSGSFYHTEERAN